MAKGECLQGKHHCFSSTTHMQLRAGVMLPSAKGELSRKQKFPTLHVVAMEKL